MRYEHDIISGETLEFPDEPVAPVEDPGPQSYRIGKSTPWRRMTNEEAISIKSAMSLQTVKNQEIYNAASYISTDDELFETLKALLSAILSPERAEQLLAPEVENEN